MFKRREQYKERLPRVLQRFVTWLTGVPHKRQQPLLRSTPWLEVVSTMVWLAVGLTLSVAGADLITTSIIV